MVVFWRFALVFVAIVVGKVLPVSQSIMAAFRFADGLIVVVISVDVSHAVAVHSASSFSSDVSGKKFSIVEPDTVPQVAWFLGIIPTNGS